MRLIFLSDIHANLEALEAVRAKIKEEGADKVYCLGDVIGYGADPEACWRTVAEEKWETTMGNHEEAIINPSTMVLMNPVARAALEWTRHSISEEGIQWLKSLPDEVRPLENELASHALPIEPRRWLYSDSPRAVLESFLSRSELIFWVGHLHFAHAWFYNSADNKLMVVPTPEKLELQEGKWLLNVGSVGQPRDEDHRACFVSYDVEEKTVIYHRVQYDTVTAARKIVDAGLPEVLAQRLFTGQ
jgi:predicted phosphodiesterase